MKIKVGKWKRISVKEDVVTYVRSILGIFELVVDAYDYQAPWQAWICTYYGDEDQVKGEWPTREAAQKAVEKHFIESWKTAFKQIKGK